jgi:tetratricopeptide (TPR) repeat protein
MDGEALRGRGYLWLIRHDVQAAIADLSAAIALNPRDARAYQYRGEAYAAKQDMRRANLDAAAALRINPSAR